VQLLLALLVVLNLASFALFGIDKRRARRGEWRIPERTLLLFGLISGTVGAWAGVYVFRHKSRKPAFVLPLAAASVVDIAVVWAIWLR
jgi:uncharacterized membrane protein YsdA (DUF1294 family)